MPATPAAVSADQLQLLVPLPPLTVDGIPGQLDLVAAIATAEAAPARRLSRAERIAASVAAEMARCAASSTR